MKTGEMLWNYSRGIDNRLVGDFQVGKRPSYWLDILSYKIQTRFLVIWTWNIQIGHTHTHSLSHLFSSIVHRANLLCKLPLFIDLLQSLFVH